MRTRVVKWLCIAVLFVAFVLWRAIPVLSLAGGLGLASIVLAAAALAISLTTPKPLPLLSIPSITNRNSGSESL